MPDTTGAVDRWGPAVYRLACAATGNRSDADDVFQEVFLRYHRSAPEFASEAHEKAWLLRVTANRTRSLLASPWRRRSVPLEDVYACSGPEESAVAEALAALPPGDRTLLHLYYYEGYRTEELARLLGRKSATVRSQLTRARQKLARLLKEEP
ncbi:RNA polymerase sigma factor [Dysosmobacter sp.]|mgnify:FL=1|uniref:RNA polymerase sigma factor n=1 Tax=Dysosmobacter sp. TaxID=2591382 RepID=UPI003A9523CB